MNVLYIYHEYYNRRRRYGNEIAKRGHQVTYVNVGDKRNGKIVELEKLDGIDMVWTLTPEYYLSGVMSEAFVAKIKKKDIPLVTYSTISTSTPLLDWGASYDPFDYVFLHNSHLTNMLIKLNILRSGHTKFKFLPLGYYPDQYHPLPKVKKRDIYISFAGGPQTAVKAKYDKRASFLQHLLQYQDVKVYGKKLCRRMGIKERGISIHEEHRLLYNRTEINIDLPFINSTVPEYKDMCHLKNRFFEVPASGGLLLTADTEESRHLIGNGAWYYDPNSEKDFVHQVAILADNPDLRETTRRNGLRIAKENRFEDRFQFMFKFMGVS